MKKAAFAIIVIMQLTMGLGQEYVIQGTNLVTVVYLDDAIPPALRTQLSNEVARMMAPTLSLIEIERNEGTAVDPHLMHHCMFPVDNTIGSDAGLHIPPILVGTGTNLSFQIEKTETELFATNLLALADLGDELEQLDIFACDLATNSLSRMTLSQIKDLFLCKEYAPGCLSDGYAEELRAEYGHGTFFMVPRQTVHFETAGPEGVDSHLWAAIPFLSSGDASRGSVHYLPLLYYQQRWWISFWKIEPGAQQWQE